jgi:hypothetical protein
LTWRISKAGLCERETIADTGRACRYDEHPNLFLAARNVVRVSPLAEYASGKLSTHSASTAFNCIQRMLDFEDIAHAINPETWSMACSARVVLSANLNLQPREEACV